jgi:hypothetical protein
MSAKGTRTSNLTAAVILLALAGSAGPAGAQARPTADSVADGARKIVQSVQETAQGIGKTLREGVTEVEQRAKAAGAQSRPVAEKLAKGAQGFGAFIWDGHEVRWAFRAEVLHPRLIWFESLGTEVFERRAP